MKTISRISKDLIYSASLKKQEELIESFNTRVAEMKDDSMGQSHSASQSESRTAGKIELLVTLEKELGIATMEMGYLKSLNPEAGNDKVEPGAIVVTNKGYFYISIPSKKMEVDGQVVYGISTNAPIYRVMQDLKKGDKFEFNKMKYKIEDVY